MSESDSIFFFTLHKCASSLFSNYVLQNLTDLQHVNYAGQLFKSTDVIDIVFHPHGHVYGPLRVSNTEDGLLYRKLLKPCLEPKFLVNKKTVCFIRDPRDILISYYHSEGWSHTISNVPEIRKSQHSRRELVRKLTLDEYARQEAPTLRIYLKRLLHVMASSHSTTLLRYEDMILNQKEFARQIKTALPIVDSVIQQMFERSKPLKSERLMSHRRSGHVGQFKRALSPDTQNIVSDCLGDTLGLLGYA